MKERDGPKGSESKAIVVTHSAISVVNALATGKGATIGIGIPCRVEVSLFTDKKPHLIVESKVRDPHHLVKTCIDYALSEIGKRLSSIGELKVRIDSKIPPAVGLKSSSAVSVAIVKAVFELFNIMKEQKSILKFSCQASKDSGASLTGAYDDAAGCLLGGLAVADNPRFRLLKQSPLPRNLAGLVEILIPPQTRYTSSVDRAVYFKMRKESLTAFKLVLKGEIPQAMFSNSLIQCVALGYSIEPVLLAILEGAKAAGITGKGPGVAAICPNERIALKVRRKWASRYPKFRIIHTNVAQSE
jgi:shikimate kinase